MAGYIVRRITGNLYILRMNDQRTEYFEGTWHIPEGITYNAYLLKTSDGAVLFDGWKKNYGREFLEALGQLVDIGEIKYLVTHHAEPDHSGTTPLILRENPEITVLGHPMAKTLLEKLHGFKIEKFKPVRNGEELVVGGEKLLFIHAPMLHWPETIFTYIPSIKTLLTCDAFGGYGIPRTIFDDDEEEINEYMFYVKKYLVTVIGFHRRNIPLNIEKLRKLNLDVKIIAPAHGLVWRNYPEFIVKYYEDTAKAVGRKKVTVIYASMYGAVEEAVMAAVDEAAKHGCKVKVYPFTDNHHSDWGNILTDVIDSDLLIIGGATYDTGIVPPIHAFLTIMTSRLPNTGKKVVIISSYGWGGLAAKQMKEILESKGYKVLDIIQFQGRPTSKDREKIRQVLSQHIKYKETNKEHIEEKQH